MTSDRPYFGVLLMLGFCVLAPLGDGLGKLLGERVPILWLVLARFGVQAAVLVPLVLILRLGLRPPAGLFWLIWARTGLHIAGLGCMFLSLRFLPLADALAIAFVMPMILLLLGHLWLGEEVGPVRLTACVIGFVGTLLVVQPNFAEVGAPALLPLAVAVIFALFMLATRRLATAMPPLTLQALSGVQACVILIPLLALVPVPEALASGTLSLLLVMGVLGTLAHLMLTLSLRYAPSATLAPMQYLEIPFGTAVGWVMFRDLPNGLAAIGIVITVAAGLYIILREQRLSRRPAPSSAG